MIKNQKGLAPSRTTASNNAVSSTSSFLSTSNVDSPIHEKNNKNQGHSNGSYTSDSILELPFRSRHPDGDSMKVGQKDPAPAALTCEHSDDSSESSSAAVDEHELQLIKSLESNASSPLSSVSASQRRQKRVQVVSPSLLPTIDSFSEMKQRDESESDFNLSGANTNDRAKKRFKRKRRSMVSASTSPLNLRQVAVISPSISLDAHLNKEPMSSSLQWLPVGQYECTLQRRAIRKKESVVHFLDIPQPKSDVSKGGKGQVDGMVPTQVLDDTDLEIEGDTSLGMKLTILSGKVIVQKLMPLQDGRASPAQLTGMISRGDVLLSIDGRPLVGLGNLDLLVERLKPLSTPNLNGEYKRSVRIRFAVGEGLELLQKDDETAKNKIKKKTQPNTKRFQVGQYTMVDQLSGAPLFHHHESLNSAESIDDMVETNNMKQRQSITTSMQLISKKSNVLSVNEAISIHLALERQAKRAVFTSAFFSMKENVSCLLKEPMERIWTPQEPTDEAKDKEERLELGKIALAKAKLLYDQVELGPVKRLLDPLQVVRNECRSFSSRSRFSLKYGNKPPISDADSSSGDESDAESFMSGEIENGEIGDEMLLRLAVWNRTWKRRMVETLEAASVHTRDQKKHHVEKKVSDQQRHADLETQLQNLMFGTEVAEIITKKKPTVALPPDEITEVLFDLATRVTATIPSNVSIVSGFETSLEHVVVDEHVTPNAEKSRADREILEATRFLIEDILPSWMNTFKPIPPQQRRVVWPRMRDESVDATPDDLSLESAATGWSTNTPERRAKLEDKIAHLELDADTKVETCELITFYFTRKILSDFTHIHGGILEKDSDYINLKNEAEQRAVRFIQTYGSYLKLYESLVAASEVISINVMNALLDVAKYDPNHIEYTKQLIRNIQTISYEPKILSSLILRLKELLAGTDAKLSDNVISLVASAYPDIKPWQVRVCLASLRGHPEKVVDENALKTMPKSDADILYSYLSLLMETSNAARMDKDLVQEWCIMSISKDLNERDTGAPIQNFMKVAVSDKLSHSSYYRDLSFLIDASAKLNDRSLMLDLANEIISRTDVQYDCNILRKTVDHLVALGLNCVKDVSRFRNEDSYIRKILVLLNEVATSPVKAGHDPIVISSELVKLLHASSNIEHGQMDLLRLMANITDPRICLDAISSWIPNVSVSTESIIPILRICLSRGPTCIGEGKNEISNALCRVRDIRFKDRRQQTTTFPKPTTSCGMSVWEEMKQGIATIDK